MRNPNVNHPEIAIIGMSCTFPGAKNPHEYWNNLINGSNHIKEIPPSRWKNEEYYSPIPTNTNKMISKWAGLLESIKSFDFQFFNLLPEETKNIDPQSRLILQEVWHCIEDAAITPSDLQKAKTSVYTAIFSLDYLQLMARAPIVEAYACLGNYPCMVANRVSHFLNLSGESFNIDAACASSLVAIHQAKTSLQQNTCDFAIISSANLICHPWHHIAFSKCRMFSPDGQCKTFDQNANGYVRGEGVAAVLLTRKELALERGLRIYGLIKGSSTNHCGCTRTISIPSKQAQRTVIETACKDASIHPSQISYIETHGTGTPVGDAIECCAICETFSSKDQLHIGSVKANIGHLEATAGLASLIKVILMLKNHTIPKQINFSKPNPIIDFEHSPLKVPLENLPWEKSNYPRLAGISSFGFGGVNAHLVIEEFLSKKPLNNQQKPLINWFPLIFSALTEESLKNQIKEHKSFFRSYPEKAKKVSYTLLKGRTHFPIRSAFLCSENTDISSPIPTLSAPTSPRIFYMGILPRRATDFLTSIQSILLTDQEKKNLRKKFSQEGLYTYLLGKLFLTLNVIPILFLGEGEGESIAYELFKLTKHPVYYFDIKNKTTQSANIFNIYNKKNEIKEIKKIDINLLKRFKSLTKLKFSFNRTLKSINEKLKKYDLSVDCLHEETLDPNRAPIVNFYLSIHLFTFYKKYQISNRYSSVYSLINEMRDFVINGMLSMDEATRILQDPTQVENDPCDDRFLLKKITKILSSNLAIRMGGKQFDFNYHIDYPNSFPQNSWKKFLEIVTKLWVNGENIQWDRFSTYFYHRELPVSLPGYSFESAPFWCQT